ncbi:MAG: ketopantoate reductase family protein [Clostridium sp.]|nr:ketopantoate reductase family protein [Clostridium sp.]
MKTLLVGPGAIGGTVAVFAAKAGFVFDVLGRPEEAEYLRDNDFALTGCEGEHSARLRAFGSIDELAESYDCVLIATKAQAMPHVARALLPRLHPDSLVLGLQNGITTELMSEVVGEERTVSCMIGIGATSKGIGKAELTSGGHFIIGRAAQGESSPEADKRLEYLRRFVNCCQPTSISGCILADLYSKLVFNACVNALCALSGMTLGKLLDDKKARAAFLSIAREGMAVAAAIGLDVPPFMGILDYRLLVKHQSKAANALFGKLFQVIGKVRIGKVHPSTLQSLERGELTEIDYLNGYFLRRGGEFGVSCPVNEQIVGMIHQIERGERQMGIHNINELKL